MTQADPKFWRKCSACKKEIPYSTLYWVCSVSTCTRKRTGLIFCTVGCWDSHVPMMRHRESWAEERHSPSLEKWQRILNGEEEESPVRPKPIAAETVEAPKPAAPASGPPKVLLRKRQTD